ncbi:ring finger ubiquitin ligase [Sporothrix brasiliensis 5110]|uniref:DSC E3 ubiquitin ligase complex subunit A n=1 Tax=Sporothrix brasiliensis 5110 TaxID=1398154 RepID=A0A0C2IN40_9PEZI|nr:ring finger ubiquitin ligase [Sporothrix brasiliensis 5110]KIH88410.1 ring finger ubiquitin ligase [Sporothrix brasiliensis 5110]
MPQPQDNARFILLVMMILWINTSNDATAGILSAPSLIMARVGRQRAAFEAIQPTQWGDFAPNTTSPPPDTKTNGTTEDMAGWLNLTGFRREDNLAWDDLDRFRARCLEWSRNAYPMVNGVSLWDRGETMLTWQNATSFVAGEWVRRPGSVERHMSSYNLSAITAQAYDLGAANDVAGRGTGIFGSGPRTSVGAAPANNTDAVTGGKNVTTMALAAAGGLLGRRSAVEDNGAQPASSNANANADTKADAKPDEPDQHDQHPLRPRPFPLQAMEWGRNITGFNGRMVLRVTDQDDEAEYVDETDRFADEPPTGGLVRTTTATVTLEDIEGTGSSYDMRLYGVHWPRQGALLLTTTSEKFAGIFGLPHLAPGRPFFDSSKRLLNRTLDAALAKRESTRLFGPPDPALSAPLWSSNVDGAPEGLTPLPRCEYVMYVQIHPLDATQFLPTKHSHKRPLGTRDVSGNASMPVQTFETREALETLETRGVPDEFGYSQEDMTRLMIGIEHEIRFPTGAPIFGRRGVPDMQMSAVLYSPDCAYFIETKGPPHFAAGAGAEGQAGGLFGQEKQPLVHLRGKKSEAIVYDARLLMLAFSAVLFGQVKLFLGQVRETYTPSTLGRISFTTMAAMVLADGLVFGAAAAWALTASASFLPSLVVTFSSFTSMTIGGYFLSEIYTAQEPERRRRDRQELQQIQQRQMEIRERLRQHYANIARIRAAASTNTANTATGLGATAATPPAATPAPPAPPAQPVIARASSPPIIVPSDQDIDAEIADNARAAATPLLPAPATAPGPGGAAATTGDALATTAATPVLPPSTPFSNMAGRMLMIGIVIMFLSLAASTWWASLRATYANILCFIYLSMWLPQIARNIERNSRRAFAWRFIFGQSLLRLLPIAYFYLRTDNILFAQTDWRAFTALVAWVWVQLWILAAQHELGPRFGIPSSWVPEAWEYHPVLREDNVEAGGLPIGLVSTAEAPATSPDEGPAGAAKRRPSNPTPSTLASNSIAANTNIWTMDCAICCEALDVPVVRAGADEAGVSSVASSVSGVLARRQYMVTPCRHIFHTKCLEGWLRFRLQCPICREELPPL